MFFLLATVCACKATLLNLLGGKGGGGSSGSSQIPHNAIPTPNRGYESAQIIKVILEQGHSGASGHHYGRSGETQVFNVIKKVLLTLLMFT